MMEENPEDLSVDMADDKSDLTTQKNWNNIAPEMLMSVLTCVHSPTNPKEMASRRLVCKHWRNVIDEHFEYWLTINDAKMDVTRVAHLRVKNCTVISLVNELDPDKPVFKSPKSLLKLSVWGEISPTNFHRLLEDAVNLKHVSLNWKALTTEGLMDELEPEEETRFQRFWDGLNTLEISLNTKPQVTALTDNLCKIFSRRMRNLSTLKMRIGFKSPDWERFIFTLYSFLGSSSNRNLKTFHFDWHSVDLSLAEPQSRLPFTGDSNNQLESLRISLLSDHLPCWISFIQVQRQLKDFRLQFRMDFIGREREPMNFRQILETSLKLNRNTLNTVELTGFNLTPEFDARIFQNMGHLKRLILRPCKYQGDYQTVLNLALLPETLETLVIGKLNVTPEDLRLAVNRLENIRDLELVGTRVRGEFVMEEIFEVLTRRAKIRRITVNPLDDRFPRVSKNGKRYLFVNGYEMEVLWKGIIPSVNFSFQ